MSRRSAVRGLSVMSTGSGSGCRGIASKYFLTFARQSAVFTSPTIAMTALFGA